RSRRSRQGPPRQSRDAARSGPTVRPPERRPPRAPSPKRLKWWYILPASLGLIAVFATCGVFSYFLVQDELAGRNAQADSGEPSPTVPRDISSREVDPEPLTVEEVFPDDEIVINPAEPPYQVLSTQESEDCS